MTGAGGGGSSIAGLLASARPNITVRPTAAADQPFCRALFDEDRAPTFAALNLDDRMLTMLLDQQFRAQQTAYRQAFADADDLILDHGGLSVGRVMIAMVAQGDILALHVIDIILAGSARGHGIATDVMVALERAGRAKGATRITLSVLHGNAGARRLYARLGYRAIDDDGARIAMIKHLA